MKFFRHHKNKPYKFIGIAKHSESLEDVVIYECLYPNETAKLWVRPKNMFFETIEKEGKSIPRFAEVPLKIETFTEPTEQHTDLIAPLMEKAFGEFQSEWFHSRLKSRSGFHLGVAYVDEKAVGFKMGYKEDKWNFYSWIGAVLPEYRGLGIAKDLMNTQHEWCRKQGYSKIQTKTQNHYKEMLLLNLKSGFEVIGTHTSEKGGIKILLEKNIL